MKQKNKRISPAVQEIKIGTWIPQGLFTALALSWLIFVVIRYYGSDRFAVNISALSPLLDGIFTADIFHGYFLKVCFSVILAACIFFSSIGTGAYLLGLFGILSDDKHGEKPAFALGLGLCVISTVTMALGFAGLYYRWVFYVVLALLGLIAAGGWRANKPAFDFSGFSSNKILWSVTGLLVSVNLAGTFVPEIFYDSLNYHLAVQNYYIQNHRILPMPTNFFSAFPMNMEMLYAFALLLSDEILAKMTHFIACAGIVMTLRAFGKRYLTEKAGLLASVFYLSMPMVAMNTGTTAVETGQTFFQFLGFYALINALLCDESRPAGQYSSSLIQLSGDETVQRRNWIVLSGIFTGFVMGIKYSAFTVLPVSLAVLAWYRLIKQKAGLKIVFKEAVLYGTIAFVMILPLLSKNLAYHKNPLYPFFGEYIGEPAVTRQKWASFKSDAAARDIAATLKNPGSLKRLLLHPWFLTMEGQSNANFIGPMFLGFLPFLIFARLELPWLRVLRFYFILNWIVWFSTSEFLRYFLSGLLFLAILLSGISEGVSSGVFFRKLFRFLCYSMAIAGSFWSLLLFQSQGGWLVLTGKMTKLEYLSGLWPSYPYPSYAAYNYINKNTDGSAKILVLGDARSYYLERNCVVSCVQDYQPLVRWAEEAEDDEGLFRRFSKEGVTHIFLNYLEAKRTEGYNLFPWDERSWAIFETFWGKHVELLWQETDMRDRKNPRALLVYTVKQKAGAPADNILREWRPAGLKRGEP